MTPEDNNSITNTVDAFGGSVSDYDRLISEFGIQPMDDILRKIPKDRQHFYMTRGIMFGHTATYLDILMLAESIEVRNKNEQENRKRYEQFMQCH